MTTFLRCSLVEVDVRPGGVPLATSPMTAPASLGVLVADALRTLGSDRRLLRRWLAEGAETRS